MTNFATRQRFTFAKSNKKMKNRSVLAPLTHNMSADNGDLSEQEIAWLNKCSEGGFGMIITAATSVSMTGRSWKGQPALITNAQQESFARIAKNAKQNDALAIVQLHHGGIRTEHQFSTDKSVSPSHYAANKYHPEGVREVTANEIETLISDFVSSAKRAYIAGMDGVEIHAAFNFLLSNFSNPLLNRRSDQWGGSFENRNRIIFDIVSQIRTQVPRDFIIGVRLSPENYAHFSGIEIEEQLQLSNTLNELDIDYIHMSLHDSFKMPNHIRGGRLTLLQWIKTKLNPEITLIVAGKISNIENANKVISHGADLVAIGKAAVGNPDWVNRINAGQKLLAFPFSMEHLSDVGFTDSAVEYMSGISGLVKDHKFTAGALG